MLGGQGVEFVSRPHGLGRRDQEDVILVMTILSPPTLVPTHVHTSYAELKYVIGLLWRFCRLGREGGNVP